MKINKKLKTHKKTRKVALSLGSQKTQEVSKSRLTKKLPTKTFSPKEVGGPDADNVPGIKNPLGV